MASKTNNKLQLFKTYLTTGYSRNIRNETFVVICKKVFFYPLQQGCVHEESQTYDGERRNIHNCHQSPTPTSLAQTHTHALNHDFFHCFCRPARFMLYIHFCNNRISQLLLWLGGVAHRQGEINQGRPTPP